MMRKIVPSIALVFLSTSMLLVTFAEVNRIKQSAFDSYAKDLNEGVQKNEWSLSNAREWGDFAYVDEDSAQIVIGLDEAHRDSFSEVRQFASTNGGKIVSIVSGGESVSAVVVDVPFDLIPSFVDEMKATGLTKYLEPNFRFDAQFVPNDQYWSLQWGPRKMEADYAWNTTTGSNSSILVAVIDSGVDWEHPDLAANYVPLGYDWVGNDTDPRDDVGHGTHVAGIIAAVLNNGVGIAGLAQVRIMAEKVLTSNNVGFSSQIAQGIVHATDQGADIINLSFGTASYCDLVDEAVKYAYSQGVLLVAAAGNGKTSTKSYPAAFDEVIAVASTDQNDIPASDTNYGDWIEVAAPGVGIYSTMPTYNVTFNRPPENKRLNYDYMSGTSMASPHVAGVAALVWSQFLNLTRDQLRVQLRYTVDDLGDPGFDIHYGYGRINARRALEQNLPDHDLILFDLDTPSDTYLWQGQQKTITSEVLNFGTENETNVEINLLINGNLMSSMTIYSLPSGNLTTVEFPWILSSIGAYNVTSYVLPANGETRTENNNASVVVSVIAPILIDGTAKTLADDPNEFGKGVGGRYDLARIMGWQEGEIVFFKVQYQVKSESFDEIVGLIFLDSDQNISTGLPDGTYVNQRARMGADYLIVMGTAEGTSNAMLKWNSDIDWWDEGDPIPLAYLSPDPGGPTKEFTVGVYLSDLQTPKGIEGAVSNPFIDPENKDWMPDVGCFRLRFPLHDVATTEVISSRRIVGQSYTTGIDVTVSNQGDFSEAISVTLYADSYAIQTMNTTLESGASTTMSFIWNTEGFAYGNYTISARVASVQGETDTSDNTCVGNGILVTIPGDVNGDTTVDSLDSAVVSAHWYPGPPQGPLGYDPNVDIDNDEVIGVVDAAIVSAHFGQSW